MPDTLPSNPPKDGHGSRPLHWAAFYNRARVAETLLEEGADVNATDYLQWTPLHIAAEHGHFDIAVVLVEEGAVVDAISGRGQTALDVAKYTGHTEVITAAIKRGLELRRIQASLPKWDRKHALIQPPKPCLTQAATTLNGPHALLNYAPILAEKRFPPVLIAFCTASTWKGKGRSYAWGLARELRAQKLHSFNSGQVERGLEWKLEWHGLLPTCKVRTLSMQR